ncbi:hypothetical protein E6O75_ATG04988 [Venturia nashicola]|uniref:Uncharacterized protein n=1 Tax=Venturia nashicola TaxID=86259 RepID=A0A4Z1P2H1_9PEZI|nr:hypothetical protein E6O75_ATG04988 [Venturia nashicola]
MAKLTNPQRSNEHQQSFTLNLTLLWTDMDDLMAAVTGFKTKAPPPNAGSPPKKAIVISLESDGDNDDDSELEEVLRSSDWEAKFQAHRGANSIHDFPSTLTHEVTHPRLPWPWSNQRTSALYTAIHKDKWWSKIPPSDNPEIERSLSHICRIMETELGEKRTDNARKGVGKLRIQSGGALVVSLIMYYKVTEAWERGNVASRLDEIRTCSRIEEMGSAEN